MAQRAAKRTAAAAKPGFIVVVAVLLPIAIWLIQQFLQPLLAR